MSVLLVVAVIMGAFIVMSISGIILALKCPNCKRWFALKWQDVHQRDICKHCAWFVYAKDFVPPRTSYLKWLQKYSPITYKRKGK
jgi:hypothetical protein